MYTWTAVYINHRKNSTFQESFSEIFCAEITMFRSCISSRYKPFVQFFSSKDGYFIFRTSLSTHSLIYFNQCQQININNRKRQFNSLNPFRKLSQSTSGKNSSLDQMEDTVDSTIEFPEGMELHQVVNALKKVFPLEFASDWDNVGLLIEPSGVLFVKNIMLTIDLTERVLDEAISKEINMIIAYHPPLFKPFKSLTQQSWKERIAIRCIENRIAVFAPHSALDSIKGGINDWLLTPFICSEVKPIERTYLMPKHMGQYEYNVYFSNSSDEFFKELNKLEACVYVSDIFFNFTHFYLFNVFSLDSRKPIQIIMFLVMEKIWLKF